ncbi:Lrp/AsnC family transcriptional regulator [Candidatus Woesearchaeota archaeon]|nr:Lrp/AsnC family transcriptional regulator [Candidatus Woesearchaeota archaeon]
MAKIDKNLLFLISEESRSKIKAIGLILKKSPQRIKYEIKVFKRENILAEPYCIIDYGQLDLILFRVYFKGGYTSEKDKARIIRYLSDNHYITSIHEFNGEYDLAVDMISPNPSRFNKEIKKIASQVPSLNNYIVLLNVVTHIYPKNYLASPHLQRTGADQETVVGGDRPIKNITKDEMTLVKLLSERPNSRLTYLSKDAEMNIKTMKKSLHHLISSRIIRGFKYNINITKIGAYKFRLFLNLHNVSQESDNNLLQFLLTTRETVQMNRTVGEWDMEIDIESLDRARVRQIILKLREEFKDIIQSFKIIEVLEAHKISYIPRYIFDEKVMT